MKSNWIALTIVLLTALVPYSAPAQEEFRLDLENYQLFEGAKQLPRDINKLYQIRASLLRRLADNGNVVRDIQSLKVLVDTQNLMLEDSIKRYPDRKKMAPPERAAFEENLPLLENDLKQASKGLFGGWSSKAKQGADSTDDLVEKYLLQRRLYTLFAGRDSKRDIKADTNAGKESDDSKVQKGDDPTPSLLDIANTEIEIYKAVKDERLKFTQNPIIKQWIENFLNGKETSSYYLFRDGRKATKQPLVDLQREVRQSKFVLTGNIVVPEDTTESDRNAFLDKLKQLIELEWDELAPNGELKVDGNLPAAREFLSTGNFVLATLVSYNHWKQAIPLMEKLVDMDEKLFPDESAHQKQRKEWRSIAKITRLMTDKVDGDMCGTFLASAALHRVYMTGITK